jgi:hypothetical protein
MAIVAIIAIPAILVLISFRPLVQQPLPMCPDVGHCRQAALDAAARSDFEAFHDLAWRTVQKGRANDPDLMYLLARAQSLSGRPGDALVMLRRLAEMGVATDARESDDFRRVRALPGWSAVEALIAAAAETRPAVLAAEAVAEPPPREVPRPTRPAEESSRPARSRTPDIVETPPPAAAAASSPAADAGEDALGLLASPLDPVGLAYDGASRRFVIGDRVANKLIVADEVFKRVNDLIGAASAGFGALTGVEIDGRRGDLWVTSTADGGASVHKLQLVSGRVLSALQVPDELRPAAFDDLSVAESGAVLMIDSAGSRLFSVKPASHGFERPIALRVASPASIAPAGSVVYVAYRDGLVVADRASGRTADVRAAAGVVVTGLRRIRWTRGALVGIQTDSRGAAALVRIRLNGAGTVATAVEALDNHREAEGSALTVSRDAVYYVARMPSGPTIRRVALR